jgi:hypothetical protein
MKESVGYSLLCDQFMLGLVLSLQASTGESIYEIVDKAVQSAINDHPSCDDISELVVYSSDNIKIALGFPV